MQAKDSIKPTLSEGKVRPFDKVKVKWLTADFGHKVDAIEEVHPMLAQKLVNKGLVEDPASIIVRQEVEGEAPAAKRGRKPKVEEEA